MSEKGESEEADEDFMGWDGMGVLPLTTIYTALFSSSFSVSRQGANIPAIRLQCGETGYLSRQLDPFSSPSIPSSSEVARSTQSFVCDESGNCFLDFSTHGSVTKDGIIGGYVDIITKSSKSGSEAINL